MTFTVSGVVAPMNTHGPTDLVPPRRLPEPKVKTTRYEVTLLPEDDPHYQLYVIALEYRGSLKWAITRHRYCLGVDGRWSFESGASAHDPEWLEQHLFSLSAALRLATEEAPRIEVNGRTAHAVLATRATHSE